MIITRKLIRTDGTETDLAGPQSIADIKQLITADCLDTVALRNMGRPVHVMIVDDSGMIDSRPVNAKATQLYHANCVPGTTHQIHGDVVVVPDGDYARE